jgi:hypothetical protein
MYLYLDESGDLGFDFDNKNPSHYFVITLLVCHNQASATIIKKAVERTLKNKIQRKKKYKNNPELKGASIPLDIKSYFYKNADRCDTWKIYSIILDKKAVLKKFVNPIDKHRVYNILANHLLKQVDFFGVSTINLFVDRSKNRDGINEFDDMLQMNLGTILPLNVSLNISHVPSHESYGIQAVDLFCWGIFRKYTCNDEAWFDIFKQKVVYEQRFLA